MLPPSATDNFTRRWLVGQNDVDPPELPANVVERLLAGTNQNGSGKTTNWDKTAAGVKEGGRHQAALSLIGKLLRNTVGLTDTESLKVQWQTVLGWNERNQPLLNRDALQAVFQDILNRERTKRGAKETTVVQASTWPAPSDAAAFHGLSGDFVRAIEPHSEADPVGLLLKTLGAFGNIVGRTAHFRAEADRHYCNLFLALVGATGSKKGHRAACK